MDEDEVALFLRGHLGKSNLLFSHHFNKRNRLPERRFSVDEIVTALFDEPLVLHGGMNKWLAINRVGKRHITVVFAITRRRKVFVITVYPSKEWEKMGYHARRKA